MPTILDTNKAVGFALYQIQIGTLKLNEFKSKGLPPAAANYFITELESLSLCVNNNKFKYLHAKVDFDFTVDH